ncbi:MAG: DUF1565 domain-containing protein [Lentisphaerae bacterium]|nr:DUF1565 domain-containing protein [Lentisphaerota bacterium]MBT5604509.1 DUF1565 domain-containing protein [Lentisphaerota bacterium]MBT7057665.1 DUF1565 domain-containing protein [Lentisphaerota bacterium]MBT7841632.1 DUF1565 domain-containing protein [Lentisphaerota bacterium]
MKRYGFCILLVVATATAWAAPGGGPSVHVAVAGNDANPGTRAAPFRTIEKALSVLQAEASGTCTVAPGIYSETIVIDGLKASADAPVRISSSTGDAQDVVITSLERVTQEWVEAEENIWRAGVTPGKPLLHTKKQRDYYGRDISAMMYSTLVFRSDKPLSLARHPNKPPTNHDLMDRAAARIDPTKSTVGGGGKHGENPRHIGQRVDGLFHVYTSFEAPLPDHCTTAALQGAWLWANCWKRWTSWILPVEEVVMADTRDPRTGALVHAGAVKVRTGSGWLALNMMPGNVAKHDNTAYLVGARALLDAEGEFHYTVDRNDPDRSYIEIFSRQDPNRDGVDYYYKSRDSGLAIRDSEHITVSDVTVRAAGIGVYNSRHCLIDGARVEMPTYGYSVSQSVMDRGLPGPVAGILVDDLSSHVTVTNSVVQDCAGMGVFIQGRDNVLHNNLIRNVNYLGMGENGLSLAGVRNTASYNTVTRCGRSAAAVRARKSRVLFNDFSNAGWLTHDMGALHSNGDVENTEIAYNWFHDVAEGNGLYLDNFNANWLAHHNVVWDIGGTGIRTNVPSNFTMLLNNTVLECRDPATGTYRAPPNRWNLPGNINNAYGPWDGPVDSFGSIWANNVAVQVRAFKGNSNGLTTWTNRACGEAKRVLSGEGSADFDPAVHTPAYIEKVTGGIVGTGTALPGIADLQAEQEVDIGAYERNGTMWRAGCNLDDPPALVPYRSTSFQYRNLINNSSFDYCRGGLTKGAAPDQVLIQEPELPRGWGKRGHGTVEARHFGGFAGAESTTSPTGRNSIFRNALLISSPGKGDLLAVFSGTDTHDRPTSSIEVAAGERYTFSAYLRIKPDTEPARARDYHDLNQASIDRAAESDGVSDHDSLPPAHVELVVLDDETVIRSRDLSGTQPVGGWRHQYLHFTAPANGKVKVGFKVSDKGNCYVDNVGLTRSWLADAGPERGRAPE